MTSKHADKLRLEFDAGDLANLVANHSTQTAATTGWAADSGITLASVLNPTRSGQTLIGTYAGRALSAAHAGSAAGAAIRSPFLTIGAGAWLGVQFSIADARVVQGSTKLLALVEVEWYNGATLLNTSVMFADYTRLAEPVPATDDSPWTMTVQSRVPVQAPATTTQARLKIIFTDRANDGSGPAVAMARTLYLSKLMAVTGASQSEAAGVPFTDAAVWQNIIGAATSAKIQRGGDVDGVTDKIEPGLLTAVILDAAIDPSNNPRVRPGRAVRLTAWNPATATWDPIFTGKLTQADVAYSEDKRNPFARPRVTITATDAVVELSNADQPYNYDGTLGQKVRALMAAALVPFNTDAGAASTTRILSDENANLWDQLVLARNSFQNAKLWVDRYGTVQCRTISPTAVPNLVLTDNTTSNLTNLNRDGSAETTPANAVAGTLTNSTLASSTAWAEQGTKSIAAVRTAAGTASIYVGPFIAGTSGRQFTVAKGDYLSARVAIRAVEAVNVGLFLTQNSAPTGFEQIGSTIAVPAGSTQILEMRNKLMPGPLPADKEIRIRVDAASGAAGAVYAHIDGMALYNSGKFPIPLESDPVPYFDSKGVFTQPTITPYLDRDVAFSSRSLVNTLMITRTSSVEIDGSKTYGPYVNSASVTSWGKITAEVKIVDGQPSVLAADYLGKYANPTIFPRSITYDYDHLVGTEQFVDLYDQARAIYTPGGVDRLLYVVGIDHDITPDRWRIKVTLRPLDQAAVSVANPSAGADTGPIDVLGPNGRAYELGNAVNLNTLTAPGDYAQSSNTEAAAGTNYPVPQAGWLEVAANSDSTMVWQRYTVYRGGSFENDTFTRTFYSGAWSAWRIIGRDYYAGEAVCTTALTCGTAAADVAGATLSVTVADTSEVFQVVATFDVQTLTTGSGNFLGRLVVNGVAQTAQCVWVAPATAGACLTVTRKWRITGLAPGVRIFKLQASGSVASVYRVNPTHTTINVDQTA